MFQLLRQALAYLYFEDEPAQQVSMKRLSREAAGSLPMSAGMYWEPVPGDFSPGTGQIVSPQPQIQMYPAGIDRQHEPTP